MYLDCQVGTVILTDRSRDSSNMPQLTETVNGSAGFRVPSLCSFHITGPLLLNPLCYSRSILHEYYRRDGLFTSQKPGGAQHR